MRNKKPVLAFIAKYRKKLAKNITRITTYYKKIFLVKDTNIEEILEKIKQDDNIVRYWFTDESALNDKFTEEKII